MSAHPVVLCLQDSTELDFKGQAIEGLGPLNYESQRGMYVHPTYGVTPDREPLGVLDCWTWAREKKDANGHRPGLKESLRWIEGYERVAEEAANLPQTRCVYVGDRESDLRALMVKARDLGYPADYLVRAKHNRVLPEGRKLWDQVEAGPVLGEIQFTLPRGKKRRSRLVRQDIRMQRVRLPDSTGGSLEVTALVACEVGAPKGESPVKWRLLTNRPATTLAEAAELIDWYRARWEIEQFFLILKEGCRVEALQLSTLERIERALALYLMVAWRIARLMRLGRTCPEMDACLLFDPDEWQAAYILNRQPVPQTPPRLNDVIRLIARVGGFIGRKRDGEPGAKTLWIGLQRVMEFATGLKHARSIGFSIS
jgi:hypothetical protein